MMGCVICNTLVLAMDHYGISSEMEVALISINMVFTIIFILEMVAKIIGLGLMGYCKDNMNIFDGVIVLSSIFELIYF